MTRKPKRPTSRRKFLRTTAGTAMVASATPLFGGCGDDSGGPMVPPTGSELKILQWNSFIPRYDTWFNEFASSWGEANNVDVTVDHVPLGDINMLADMEIAAGEGHDLIEFIATPASRELDVHDLTDVNMEAQSRFGTQVEMARSASFNSVTNKWFGFSHGWVPDPGDYRKSLWEAVGFPNGPQSWDDLLAGGRMIKQNDGIPLGLGMSNELDSNMATRALLWSFGATIQDAQNNVTINSQATLDAIDFMRQLFMDTMDTSVEDIFNWTPASNNQALGAGRVSYILNSISAYRTAQTSDATTADDIFFTPALPRTTGGTGGLAGTHVIYVYIVPSFSPNKMAAEDFLLALTEQYSDAVYESELYNMAAFPGTATDVDTWLASDPFMSSPGDKLSVLQTAEQWTTGAGHPGTSNAAAAEVFNTSIIPTMFRDAVMGGDMAAATAAVAQAEDAANMVYESWRSMGLI